MSILRSGPDGLKFETGTQLCDGGIVSLGAQVVVGPPVCHSRQCSWCRALARRRNTSALVLG